MSEINNKKGKSILEWLLWWQVGKDELNKQTREYETLKITQSAKGQSFLLNIFSATITLLFILVGSTDAWNLLDVFILLILGFFIFKGHRWAMVAAMVVWTLEKLISLIDGNGGILAILWWAIYMHAYYVAYKVENMRVHHLSINNKIYCSHCGKQIDSDSKYCIKCGNKLPATI
ncbi:MAG TPA: zinc-ribbon domain-containing protein [Patescibacteria group bacterium]